MVIIIHRIIEYRRHLHMYPEIGFNTPNTKKYIQEKINEINYDKKLISLDIIEYKWSLIITLKTKESKIIGFRSDIDALEIEEKNNITYKSKNNYMHACGHDAHTAILLFLLIYYLENPKELKGTIRAIFQTAEEGPNNGGAFYLINHPKIKEIEYLYALHVNSELASNKIYFKYDYIMASSTIFKITLHGKTNHVTKSDNALDVLKNGINIYNELMNINYKPNFLYITKISSGVATNIIPDMFIMEGTIRTFGNNNIKEIIMLILQKYNIKYEITFNDGYPSLKNDFEATYLLVDVLEKNKISYEYLQQPFLLADDFSRYALNSKICYFFLGTLLNKSVSLHSNDFNINEDSLITGFEIYKKIVSEYFGD